MCKTIQHEVEAATDAREKYKLEKEIHTLREKVKKAILISKNKKIVSNMTKQQCIGRKKMYADTERVYLPADKGKVMVVMDRTMEKGGENSYEHKMKKVLNDMNAKPSTRRKDGSMEDWDVTENVSREGRTIIQEMLDKGEISEQNER